MNPQWSGNVRGSFRMTEIRTKRATHIHVWSRGARILDMHSSEKRWQNKTLTHIHDPLHFGYTRRFQCFGTDFNKSFFISFSVRFQVRSHSNRKAEEPFLFCFFSIFHQCLVCCVPVARERDLIKIDRNCADDSVCACLSPVFVLATAKCCWSSIRCLCVYVRSFHFTRTPNARGGFEFVGNWIYFIIAWRWFEGMRTEMRKRKKMVLWISLDDCSVRRITDVSASVYV